MAIFLIEIPYSLQKPKNPYCRDFSIWVASGNIDYSSPRLTVASENGHLPTTQQEPELMFRSSGLLHCNVITAAGLLS